MFDIVIDGIKQLGQGGFLMVPLLFCSIIAHTIIFERLYNLRKSKLMPERFISKIYRILEFGDAETAMALCESRPGPLTNILKVGINNRDLSEEELEAVINLAAQPERSKLKKYIRTLSFIASVSVLIGLLGTVLGLFISFMAVFKGTGLGQTTAKIAEGISVALLTTVGGLAVAIPAMIAHSFFMSKADDMINEITRRCIEFVRFLTTGKSQSIEEVKEND